MFEYKKSYYKAYNPKLYTAKTVLWFTREEIKILKSCSRCNLWMFLLTTILIIIFLILYLTNAYPFTHSEAATVHTSIGILFIAHSLISLLGYYSILAENSCLIDIYCAMNGILIVSDITLLVIFNHYAEGRVKSYFRNNLLIQVILVLFICVNSILIPAAFVVELQVRAHGGVDRRKTSGLPGGPPLGPSPPPPFLPYHNRGFGAYEDAESGRLNETLTTTTSDPSIGRGRSYQMPIKSGPMPSDKPTHTMTHTRTRSQPEHVILRQPVPSDVRLDMREAQLRGPLPKIPDPTPVELKRPPRKNHSVTVHREEEEVDADAQLISSESVSLASANSRSPSLASKEIFVDANKSKDGKTRSFDSASSLEKGSANADKEQKR